MSDSVLESEVDSVTAQELDALMKEFPEWSDEFPEIQQQLQFARGRPPLRELRTSPYRTAQSAHDFKPYERVTPSGGFTQSPRHTSPGRRAPDNQNGKGDFPGQYPQTERQDRLPQIFPRGLLRMSQGKFDGRTTAQEHFKKWKPQPIFTFGELPSFTGSILYPGKKAAMETTTGSTFKGIPGKRSDPFHPGEGNLKIEGERHLDTTSRSTFVNFVGAQPAMKVSHNPEVIVQRRGRFNGETQSKRDFPGFSGRQPPPPRPVPPAPETIDIKFDNLRSFETEQRKQFPGIDTRLHPMMKSSKKEEEAYKLPTVQFETMTSQKMDYRPIDLTKAGQQSVAEARKNVGKMPHFDPMAPPVNNFFHRHVAAMASRVEKEARGTLKPVVSKTGAKLLTKKQAQFLLKELRMRKAQMAKSTMAQPVLPVNTVRVK